jgi:Protein of unknown function (DUF2817)
MWDPTIHSFSPDYATARRVWLELAAARGLEVQSHLHPLPGPQGEALAMDVVREGLHDASKVLLLTSGVHGVEGHVGCGIQAGLLRLGASLREAADADTAIVYAPCGEPLWLCACAACDA